MLGLGLLQTRNLGSTDRISDLARFLGELESFV